MKYIKPAYEGTAFNCIHCGVYAKQEWGYMRIFSVKGTGIYHDTEAMGSVCEHCQQYTLWNSKGEIKFPFLGSTPFPNDDMPDNIKQVYIEASSILILSPKGAAALLRLALQMLCMHLGEPGKDLNQDIKSLVSRGLPLQVQQALDVLRIVGNQAVHPGEISFDDNPEIAKSLFGLLNLICDVMISQPKKVDELYLAIIPERLRDAVVKRDGK